MYNYTRYDLSTGKIIGQGSNNNKENVKVREGQGILEGHYDKETHMIKKGKAVKKPKKIIVEEETKSLWSDLKNTRNYLLTSSDWTQVPDSPVDKDSWAKYRQELRDITKGLKDPRKVTWPTPPNKG